MVNVFKIIFFVCFKNKSPHSQFTSGVKLSFYFYLEFIEFYVALFTIHHVSLTHWPKLQLFLSIFELKLKRYLLEILRHARNKIWVLHFLKYMCDTNTQRYLSSWLFSYFLIFLFFFTVRFVTLLSDRFVSVNSYAGTTATTTTSFHISWICETNEGNVFNAFIYELTCVLLLSSGWIYRVHVATNSASASVEWLIVSE